MGSPIVKITLRIGSKPDGFYFEINFHKSGLGGDDEPILQSKSEPIDYLFIKFVTFQFSNYYLQKE